MLSQCSVKKSDFILSFNVVDTVMHYLGLLYVKAIGMC